MSRAHNTDDLTGKLLIAMPGMGDPRFERSVIFICDHGPDSTMGLIVNKPLPDVAFATLLDHLSIRADDRTPPMPVHFGGPVESGRGFVLHSAEYTGDDTTLKIGADFAMTDTRDILDDLAVGKGPARAIMALGYAGWGRGQLTSEIGANGWLTCEADADVVFAPGNEGKWGAALALLGIDPLTLSTTAGRA